MEFIWWIFINIWVRLCFYWRRWIVLNTVYTWWKIPIRSLKVFHIWYIGRIIFNNNILHIRLESFFGLLFIWFLFFYIYILSIVNIAFAIMRNFILNLSNSLCCLFRFIYTLITFRLNILLNLLSSSTFFKFYLTILTLRFFNNIFTLYILLMLSINFLRVIMSINWIFFNIS